MDSGKASGQNCSSALDRVPPYSWVCLSPQTYECMVLRDIFLRELILFILLLLLLLIYNNNCYYYCCQCLSVLIVLIFILQSCELLSIIVCWLLLTVEGEKTFSATTSVVTFHINAMDKTTAETVKEKLAKKAKDLIATVEIKEDGVKRLGKHLTKKIKSLSTSHVTVEIGMNANCCKHHLDIIQC